MAPATVSGLNVSDDAKTLLKAMVEGDGLLHRQDRGLRYEASGTYFLDDDFQRWGLAIEELIRLSLVTSHDGAHTFEVTLPGAKSGVMYLKVEQRNS